MKSPHIRTLSNIFHFLNPHNILKLHSIVGIAALLFLVSILGSCSWILIPRKQTVTFQTDNKDAKVFLRNELVGKGKSFSAKVEKNGAQQVIVRTPEHKDAYDVIVPVKRAVARPFLVLMSFGFFVYPGLVDMYIEDNKFFPYSKNIPLKSGNLLEKRSNNQKYVKLEAIKLKIDDKSKDIRYIDDVEYTTHTNIVKDIEAKELEFFSDERKREQKEAAKAAKRKKTAKEKLVPDSDKNEVNYDDTKFSEMVFNTLKTTGYIDTVNKVFQDNNNTIYLEGVIKKSYLYEIETNFASFYKTKLNITWYVMNSYGEKLDSQNFWSYSGNFPSIFLANDKSYQMYADAVDFSYFTLLKSELFQKHLAVDSNYSINDQIITLKKPTKVVKEIGDATAAAVSIKRSDKGHGSGFAITHDGYILTNYHVIAGDYAGRPDDIKIVLSDGEEIPVKLVRYNKSRDLALLKVEKNFDVVFELKSEKSYKKLSEIYAVGTPKSLELGQSVSLGILSNERKVNSGSMLQVNMSINPGNSGGALFDKAGNLHGVVTSKLVGFATEGVGFAIPSHLIPSYLNLKVD
jgi:serine protease Do